MVCLKDEGERELASIEHTDRAFLMEVLDWSDKRVTSTGVKRQPVVACKMT